MKDVAVVIPAAGQGLRFGGNVPKQFVPVMGKPLLCWTIFAVLDAMPLSPCVIVLPRDNFQYYKESLVAELGRHIGLSLRESSRIRIEGNGEVYLLGAGVYITIVPGGSERIDQLFGLPRHLRCFVGILLYEPMKMLFRKILLARMMPPLLSV
jgi:2-C-methyl-D-erythritol 4-phosphate cytidylyltransferase